MNANTTINRSTIVHSAFVSELNGLIGGTDCGSDGRQGQRPYYRRTTAPVTCSKCLKIAAK